jgi:hypothetical protein
MRFSPRYREAGRDWKGRKYRQRSNLQPDPSFRAMSLELNRFDHDGEENSAYRASFRAAAGEWNFVFHRGVGY